MENTRVLHYEILRLLGRGAMGEVYEARDTRLGRLVALKFVAPSLADDADAARRFEREAHSAAALSHPHIATLYALEHDGGRLFIATELLRGETLRARVSRGPLPVADALEIARDVASALAHAHRRGVVHRDIKPENLMFAEDRDIKVTDFGLALMTQASHLTATDTALGTPSYMAPESLHGSVSSPADVFALGIVLFEMLVGARPFVADTLILMLYQIANAEPPALRARRPELSADIESLVSSMLIKDPGQRPDAVSVAAQLSALTGAAPPPFEPDLPRAGATAARESAASAPTQPMGAWLPSKPGKSRSPSMTRTALVGLVLLGVAAWGGPRVWKQWAARSAPDTSEPRRLRARALSDDAAHFLTEGRLDSAGARASMALELDPSNAGARINLAQVLRRRGEKTRAADLLLATARDGSVDRRLRAVAWAGLGEVAMDDETWPDAVSALQQSFVLDSSERAFSQLGYALIRSSRPGEALTLLRRGLATYPGSAPLHKNAGYALLQLDSLDAARAETDRAVALQPSFGPALGLRVRLDARAGDRRSAALAWRAYVATHPSPADSAEIARELERAAPPH